jgi:hypothetical protein
MDVNLCFIFLFIENSLGGMGVLDVISRKQ